MGRQMSYRHRVRSEAASIKAKTLFDFLASQIKHRREVSRDEAHLIATDALDYLNQALGLRKLGQIEFPAVVADSRAHYRLPREKQNEKLVELTVLADDDAEVLEEFGARVMVNARLARVIEEAFFQGALLDLNRLCLLFPVNARALRERLGALIDQGATLPLAGMSRAQREKFRALRPALAVGRYLEGESLAAVRRDLCLSATRFRQYWKGFRQVLALKDRQEPEEIAASTSWPLALVRDWLLLLENLEVKDLPGLALEEALGSPAEAASFRRLLQERHGYTPAAADDFCLWLGEVAKAFLPRSRSGGQVVYVGVSSEQGPGGSLQEARLEAVTLDYVLAEDWQVANRDRPRELKWQRILRFSTQAYAQGAALNLPDLAFLVSASVDAVRRAMGEHPEVALPTRGRVADMGTTLCHAEKVIDLFMHGYTETEITRRTGHSYQSVERYLLDFSKVVFLLETGLPLPAIRQTTEFSTRLVKRYHELYQRYSDKDYAFGLAKIRRFARANPPPKPRPRKGDGKDDDG